MSVEAELEESVNYTPLQRMRHSAAHVMAEAVLEVFPDAKLAIGPAIEDGFSGGVRNALESRRREEVGHYTMRVYLGGGQGRIGTRPRARRGQH